MRKSTLLVLVFSLSLASLSIANVVGHAPSAVTLAYSTETQVLTVNITHNVVDNSSHYILKVEITKNSEIPEVHTYTSQPSLNQFTYEYPLVANLENIITVKATCVIVGDRTASLTIQTGSTSTTTSAPSQGIAGFPGWIMVFSGGISLPVFIGLYRRQRRKRV